MQHRSRDVWIVGNLAWNLFNFRAGLIKGLLGAGYAVTVCCPTDAYLERLKSIGVSHVGLRLNSAGTNPLRELATLWRIWRLLRVHRPRVLLTFTPKINIYFVLAAWLLRIPCIPNISGLGRAFTAGGWLEAVARTLYRLAFRSVQVVFFQNRDDRDLFVDSGFVRPEACRMVPGSGIDLQHFSPAFTDAPQTGAFRFLLVGRMLWDKGIGEYVEAARIVKARFPQVECGLLGFLDVNNPAAISLSQIEVWQFEGLVKYHGAADDVRPLMAASDCVVLPSYREGTPRALLEAASMGIPIIATDAVGCREVVEDDKSGYLCRLKDPDDLAEKMCRLLALDREARREMGRHGREKMEREFDQGLVVEAYLRALDTASTFT